MSPIVNAILVGAFFSSEFDEHWFGHVESDHFDTRRSERQRNAPGAYRELDSDAITGEFCEGRNGRVHNSGAEAIGNRCVVGGCNLGVQMLVSLVDVARFFHGATLARESALGGEDFASRQR